MSTTGEIPQSTALAEAKVDSLGELLSRDPLGFQKQERSAVVAALREQRTRWEAAELLAASQPKARKPAAGAKSLIAAATSDDLGL